MITQIALLSVTISDLENNEGFRYFSDKPDERISKLLLNKERCLSCKNSILTEDWKF